MRRWMGILLCVMPLTAFGATRLVTTAGADVGDCTVAPCATINYAVGQAVDGDTIDVGPGTFNNGGANVNITKTLIVVGEQAGVDARGRVATETLITVPVLMSEDNVVFDGFTVTCGACTGIDAGIVTSPSFSGYQVLNNIVTGNPVGIFPGSTGATQAAIQFNHITDNNEPGPSRGIYTNNSVTNLLIDQNWIDGHKGQNILISGTDLNPAYAIITNNTFAQDVVDDGNAVVLFDNNGTRINRNVMTGGAFSPIFIGGGDTNIQIHENSITGSASYAFVIGDSGPGDNGSIDIQFNTIMNNLAGVVVGNGNPVPIEIHFNRIVNNTTDMETAAVSTVNAENNWWGCNEGPAVCATATVFAGSTIDDDPWIVMDIAAAPASITTLQTSTVTSDFLQNSNGVAISGTFDFTPTSVAFSATNGTMTPPTDDLSGGAASSTFTPTSSSIATVSASLDDETVSTNVTVSLITVTMTLTSDNNPSELGENVTFTATISNPAATGTVTFTDGATPLGVVAVAGGVAQLTTNALTLGSHTISASYSGDATFTPATAALTQEVELPASAGITIPTLSEWMLLLLAAMLAGAAMLTMKR